MKKALKIIIWAGVVFLVLYAGFLALGLWNRYDQKRTAEAVERINSRKITLDDAMGKNLPPEPDKALNDSTVAGVDANNNAIRDDVELEIFKRYPNSAKTRAAMLQYAQALQLELTEVFNSETLVTTIKKENLAFFCLGEINNEKLYESQTEIEKLVLDTDIRKKKIDKVYEYMTTYSSPRDKECDIDISSLNN